MVSRGLLDELTAFWREQHIDEELEKRFVQSIRHNALCLCVQKCCLTFIECCFNSTLIPSAMQWQKYRLATRTPPVYRTQRARAVPPRHWYYQCFYREHGVNLGLLVRAALIDERRGAGTSRCRFVILFSFIPDRSPCYFEIVMSLQASHRWNSRRSSTAGSSSNGSRTACCAVRHPPHLSSFIHSVIIAIHNLLYCTVLSYYS